MSKKRRGASRNNARGAPRCWYRITNLGGGGAEAMIYDEIGYFGVSANDFVNELGAIRGPLTLKLNSPGGEVFDGIAIYNALRSRGNVAVEIDGLAASIASVIAMAADPGKLTIARRASMMIHDGFSSATGNAQDMRELAELLDTQSENIAGIYADRTGKDASYWRAKMRRESWYNAAQALEDGLVDGIVDAPAVHASWSGSPLTARVIAARAGATTMPEPGMPVVVNADGNHAPMTGSHTHSHPAYGGANGQVHSHEHAHEGDASHRHTHPAKTGDGDGGSGDGAAPMAARSRVCPACSTSGKAFARFCDHCGVKLLAEIADNGWVCDPDGNWRFDPDGDGDDDSTPEGDTDHDYFDEDGRPIKAIPPKPHEMAAAMRRTLFATDVDTSPWDADKAWHAGANADDPAAFYAAICAGRRAGDPKLQSSWALPYRYTPTSAPNAAGVRAALARLSGTQGLTNKEQAQSKLEGLMKKINPDYESTSDAIDSRLLQAYFTSALEGSNR